MKNKNFGCLQMERRGAEWPTSNVKENHPSNNLSTDVEVKG